MSASDPGFELVLDSMRIAERAHRTHNQFRKAPAGEDRPPYFIHVAEVAWLVQDAGYAAPCVAAAYLHDVIEDCDYTEAGLAAECANADVARMVAILSEPEKDVSWETRNAAYFERMKISSPEVLAISCADKLANMRDMLRMMDKGHAVDSFTKRGFEVNLRKFEQLGAVYAGRIEARLYARYAATLARFREAGTRPGTVSPA